MMKNVSSSQFTVMASMIEYAYQHFDDQPSLEQMAARVGLSPSYAQRQFQEWLALAQKICAILESATRQSLVATAP
jgi:AraC family transcriptional regulator of adaptative response/methylated-DNA-[protein]-cysteine methyltransferase